MLSALIANGVTPRFYFLGFLFMYIDLKFFQSYGTVSLPLNNNNNPYALPIAECGLYLDSKAVCMAAGLSA
jgi:hypothetical protein